MARRTAIGFDRRIDIEWLDAAAAQAAADVSNDEFRDYLWTLLEGVIRGDSSNSARGKTVTVLNHIWGDVPPSAQELRTRVLARLQAADVDERLALHWSMMLGTYPLFTDVAAAAGRLTMLQGSFSLAQLTRRLVGAWGERSTLKRAAQRIIRSMIQWEVLRDCETRGLYEAARKRRKIGPTAGVLLVEALLVDADHSSLPFEQLVGHPATFPFKIELNVDHMRASPQFQVHREGLSADLVEIRQPA